MEWLVDFLHSWPHLTFTLRSVASDFLPSESDYRQALGFWAVVTLLFALLLLVVVVVTWACRCCTTESDAVHAKSVRAVRRLSIVLFIISIFCFAWLGVSLFGNEHMNRGVSSAVTSLVDLSKNVDLAQQQTKDLEKTNANFSTHLRALNEAFRTKTEGKPLNETAVSAANHLFTNLTDMSVRLSSSLRVTGSIAGSLVVLKDASIIVKRVEFERWVLCVTLLSIALIVLFAGVIGFCRRSKKGAVAFSALGLVIFLVAWLLLSLVVALTLGLADYCANPNPFLKKHINGPAIRSLEFFESCNQSMSHDNDPEQVKTKEISAEFDHMQQSASALSGLLSGIFNGSTEFKSQFDLINTDISTGQRSVGALMSTLSCHAFQDDLLTVQQGLCHDGMLGAFILLISLLLTALFLFILLLIVSKSWSLFTRRPSDYVEVDEDDPFFPRTNDSTIPVDIYGTHVYNPRTRFANNSTESEPGENGQLIATMDRADQSTSTPLWQRGAGGGANAPPAYDAVRGTEGFYG